MHLKILLPFRVFADEEGVTRVVAETIHGSFGLLPRRLDCVAALVPGILTYETESAGEVFVAVDEGILVKTGSEVYISVRHAFGDAGLGELQEAVEQNFLRLSEEEKNFRSVIAKLESDFIRRFMDFKQK